MDSCQVYVYETSFVFLGDPEKYLDVQAVGKQSQRLKNTTNPTVWDDMPKTTT